MQINAIKDVENDVLKKMGIPSLGVVLSKDDFLETQKSIVNYLIKF